MTFTKGAVVLWPSNSVLLAAFLLLGRRDFIPFISWEQALSFGVGNVTEALVAFVLLKHLFILSRDGDFLGVHIVPKLLLPYVVYAGARFGLR